MNTAEFVRKAIIRHGDKYDYSLSEYHGIYETINIVCPSHGTFCQVAHYHLQGHGCNKCSKENIKNKLSMTQDEFVRRSNITHNCKYDYSKCKYKNQTIKVEIICPTHGSFFQRAGGHIGGKGCPKCKKNFKDTQGSFIEKAYKKFGDIYKYDKVVYIDGKTNVSIFCSKHNSYFDKSPNYLLRSKIACPTCLKEAASETQRMSLRCFVDRASALHQGKYSYHRSNYLGSNVKIEIGCHIHGAFFQLPQHHLRGCGCPRCAIIQNSDKQRKPEGEVIEGFRRIHGNKFDYDMSGYVGCDSVISIFCKKHNKNFFQTPYQHENGRGCPECVRERIGKNLLDINLLIKRANIIHKNKYNYSEVEYEGCDKKVTIICPIHGSFSQSMYGHVRSGNGCPRCCGRISAKESRWLDLNGIPDTNENRQVNIVLKNGKRINVDGYIQETKTIYEFFGDYWHGNPKTYHHDRINVACNKTYLELYEKTIKRISMIKESGYNLVYIWESDFKNISLVPQTGGCHNPSS